MIFRSCTFPDALCGTLIMMDQASQMVDADDRLRHIGWSAAGRDRMIAKGLVWPFTVVVHDRHGENFPQAGLAVANHFAERESFQRADEPLDVPVFPRAPRRRPLHGNACVGKHATESRSEQLISVHLDGRSFVLGQEPNINQGQRASAVRHEVFIEMHCGPDHGSLAGGDVYGDQYVHEAQPARIVDDGPGEVDGDGVIRRYGEIVVPAAAALWCRWNPVPFEDAPNGAGCDVDAEAIQFPGNAPTTPGVVAVIVLQGELDDQRHDLGCRGRPAARRGAGGADQLPEPFSDRVGGGDVGDLV